MKSPRFTILLLGVVSYSAALGPLAPFSFPARAWAQDEQAAKIHRIAEQRRTQEQARQEQADDQHRHEKV